LKKKMTDRLIRSITPHSQKRIEISDTERVGLRFRMSPQGNTSWIYQKKIKGGLRRGFYLGSYPSVSLSEARSAALEIQINAERGIDPVLIAKEQAEIHEAERLARKSVRAILDLYVQNHIEQELKLGQSRDERKRQLYSALSERLDSPISKLTRAELQSVIDDKQAEGKVYMANRIRAAIRAFTVWAHKRGHVDQDIGALLQSAGREAPRDRTPSLEEVQAIWSASFEMGHLWGPYIRLCILTGQRSRSDVLQMQWDWIDFSRNRYEIPNPKNGRPHIVHLSDPAIGELQRLKKQQASQTSAFVFTTTGKRAASGVSKAKLRLDQFINLHWAKLGHKSPFQPWVLHDLRRSQATALAEAGFDEGVVDRIQNHVASGSRASAVAAVYNKAQKLTERAAALDAWAGMVTGRHTNILQPREA
jgi:integrase